MNEQLKKDGYKAAEIFIATMPTDIEKEFKSRSLQHKLAFFYCWIEEMKDLVDEESTEVNPSQTRTIQ